MLYAQAKLPEGVKGANAARACIAVILACTPIMPKIYWDKVHLGKIAINRYTGYFGNSVRNAEYIWWTN